MRKTKLLRRGSDLLFWRYFTGQAIKPLRPHQHQPATRGSYIQPVCSHVQGLEVAALGQGPLQLLQEDLSLDLAYWGLLVNITKIFCPCKMLKTCVQWVLPLTNFLLSPLSLFPLFFPLIIKAVFSECIGICFYTFYTSKWKRLAGEVACPYSSGELSQGY